MHVYGLFRRDLKMFKKKAFAATRFFNAKDKRTAKANRLYVSSRCNLFFLLQWIKFKFQHERSWMLLKEVT